jgi:hypothetical protein
MEIDGIFEHRLFKIFHRIGLHLLKPHSIVDPIFVPSFECSNPNLGPRISNISHMNTTVLRCSAPVENFFEYKKEVGCEIDCILLMWYDVASLQVAHH